MSGNKCLIENCEGKESVRGLCARCYQAARLVVKFGETEWVDLELLGLALPRFANSKFKRALAKSKQGGSHGKV